MSPIPSNEQVLINNTIPDFRTYFYNQNIRLVDLECGNEFPVKPILDQLQIVDYLPVNISKKMIALAETNLFKANISKTLILDIENDNIKPIFYTPKKIRLNIYQDNLS